MDFSGIGIFNALQKKMRFTNERQAVLAKNVANAHIPGYKAKDLKPVEFDKLVGISSKSVKLAKTHPMHMPNSSNLGSFKRFEDKTFETSPTGNSVVLEEQALKIGANKLELQQAANIYKKMTEIMKLAASSQGGGQ